MTIKIEFPSDRKDIALAIGQALVHIGSSTTAIPPIVETDCPGDNTCTDQGCPHNYTETENTSHEQLADDGAGLLDDDVNEVPPPADDSELDSRGFPWDKRIHSANKSKNADDTWRYSRKPKNFETKEQWNIYIEQIEEELKGSDEVPPPADDIDFEADEPTAADVFGQSETPADDISPPVEDDVPPPPADEYPEKTFGELMTLITSNQKKGSVAAINDVLAEMGITGTGNSALPVLKSDHPERISEAYAKLEGKL